MTCRRLDQKEVFSSGEGDAWFERNSNLDMDERISRDLILSEIKKLNIRPENTLEVGCAEGWRINVVQHTYGSDCYGVDPSTAAIHKGRNLYPELNLKVGTAEKLEFPDKSMDLCIVGFCLYLCDRKDLFKIAQEIDRVLNEGGLIVILDFYSESPYRNEYSHKLGVYSYKMDYSKMFLWNPCYQMVSQRITSLELDELVTDRDERISITCLRKSSSDAFMTKPVFNE